MIRRPPRSTPLYSSAASDVYKRQPLQSLTPWFHPQPKQSPLPWLKRWCLHRDTGASSLSGTSNSRSCSKRKTRLELVATSAHTRDSAARSGLASELNVVDGKLTSARTLPPATRGPLFTSFTDDKARRNPRHPLLQGSPLLSAELPNSLPSLPPSAMTGSSLALPQGRQFPLTP